MNGDKLLDEFLCFIEKEKPERFGFGSHRDLHGYPCKISYVKEGCYGAYDAVIFVQFGDLIYDVIPVEAKADTDVFDDRLRAQIWVAIKNFGKSLLLVDVEQSYKIRKHRLDKMLPCEIWGFNGTTFLQVSEEINKFHYDGEPRISQRAIEKAFGIHEPKTLREINHTVWLFNAVVKKLIFNQWNFNREKKFSEEEARIAYTFLGYPVLPNVILKPAKQDASVRSTGFSDKTIQKTLGT